MKQLSLFSLAVATLLSGWLLCGSTEPKDRETLVPEIETPAFSPADDILLAFVEYQDGKDKDGKRGDKKDNDKKNNPKKNDPKKDNDKKNDPKKDNDKKNDPKKDNDKKNDPKKDNDKKNDPKKDNDKKNDPKKDNDKKNDPKKDNDKKNDPKKDNDKKNDPKKDNDKKNDPKKDNDKKNDPKKDNDKKNDPKKDNDKKNDPKKDDDKKNDPKKDDDKKNDPKKDNDKNDPKKDDDKKNDPKRDDDKKDPKRDDDKKNDPKIVGGLKHFDVKVGNAKREALVHIPKAALNAPAPIIFVFHGHGGSMKIAANEFEFEKHWPEAICVYMQGVPTATKSDPKGADNGWQNEDGDRDLRFFDKTLADLDKICSVDQNRVFVTGFSNGGNFNFRLWAERGHMLAAVAPCSGSIGRNVNQLRPRPCLMIAGKQEDRFGNREDWIDALRKVNGCQAKQQPWGNAGKLQCSLYPSATGAPLITAFHPGGHEVPDQAGRLIVQFFKENSRR